MATNEKATPLTAGITILPQSTTSPSTDQRPNAFLSTIEDMDSMHSSPALTPIATRNSNQAADSSPFYHDVPLPSDSKTHIHAYDSDVEACLSEDSKMREKELYTKGRSVLGVKKIITADLGVGSACQQWPGRQDLKAAKKREKKAKGRSCANPMRGLDKRTKIIIKVLIALVVVGLATGVGVGISKAVGGGVFKTNSTTAPVS